MAGRGKLAGVASVFLFAAALPTSAAAPLDWSKVLTDGDFNAGVRYRLERVRQDGIDDEATASTGRLRLGWVSGPLSGFSVGIETDYVFVVGFNDYNSTVNQETRYPIVADPDGFDLNQLFLRYGTEDLHASIGRQRINHGAQRIVGGVAWRQNEQTFDAFRLQRDGRLNLDYAYVWQVNRIFGPDEGIQPPTWDSNSHFFRAAFEPVEDQTIDVYAYLMDFQNDNGPANSNATWGASYNGTLPFIELSAAFAQQTDWGDNPTTYDATLLTADGRVDLKIFDLNFGYQRLGGDGVDHAFRTPLATLHKWQGWTDKFLTTPPGGVTDSWFAISKRILGADVILAYHDFRLEEQDLEAGRELGLAVTYTPIEKLDLQFKMARYWAEAHASDTTKIWAVASWNM